MKKFKILLSVVVVLMTILFAPTGANAQALAQGSEARTRINAVLSETKDAMQKVKYGQGDYYILAMRADIGEAMLRSLDEGKLTTEVALKSAYEHVQKLYANIADVPAKAVRLNAGIYSKRLRV